MGANRGPVAVGAGADLGEHLEIRTPASSRFLGVFSAWRRGRGTNAVEAVEERLEVGYELRRGQQNGREAGYAGKRKRWLSALLRVAYLDFSATCPGKPGGKTVFRAPSCTCHEAQFRRVLGKSGIAPPDPTRWARSGSSRGTRVARRLQLQGWAMMS